MRPEPFRVAIPDRDLDDLRRRLRDTRWADDFGNESWYYGVERGWLEEMVGYWADDFDWRSSEADINRFPQYRVEIDSIPIHYIHVRGAGHDPMPLILTHGWPWTFWDWKDVIEPLAAAGFDVIVPSLPGMGFSTPLRTTGVGARRIAELWVTLMQDVLGYERFAAGGGDWGSVITAELGHAHPEPLTGVWLTLPMIPGINLREIRRADFAGDEEWMADRLEEARDHIQSHSTVHRFEPQTLAYALADSPTGTAAWLWARRRNWSDCQGDVLTAFDRDFLCATASIYWLTGTIATSLRIYIEHFRPRQPPALHDRERLIDVPTGIAVFPKELLFLPRSMAERRTNLQRWAVMPSGGHFAPSEQPELVVGELRAFFEPLRGS